MHARLTGVKLQSKNIEYFVRQVTNGIQISDHEHEDVTRRTAILPVFRDEPARFRELHI